MARTVYITTGITGGGSNLDGIAAAGLNKGDMALVYFSTNVRKLAVYWCTTDTAAESAPGKIKPDTTGTGAARRWTKIKKFSTST